MASSPFYTHQLLSRLSLLHNATPRVFIRPSERYPLYMEEFLVLSVQCHLFGASERAGMRRGSLHGYCDRRGEAVGELLKY